MYTIIVRYTSLSHIRRIPVQIGRLAMPKREFSVHKENLYDKIRRNGCFCFR